MRYGVQLYGGMPYFNANPSAFLKSLAQAGYDVIEPCLLLQGEPLPFAWTLENLAEYVTLAKSFGLGFDSCHIFADDFSTCVPQMLKAAQIAGFKRFVVGYNGAFTREALDAFADRCTYTCDMLAEHGLELWIHNCGAEIAAQIDGISAYEYILKRCDGKLGAQVDTGWVVCGGVDLKTLLERSEAYIRSIHHKDVTSPSLTPENVPLNRGIVDNVFAHAFALKRDLPQLVDQDSSNGWLMDDLAKSVHYLNTLDR